jgi:hypothetical protein
MQAFLHGRDVPPPSAQVVASGWDPVGEWRHQLSVQFFDSEYSVPYRVDATFQTLRLLTERGV